MSVSHETETNVLSALADFFNALSNPDSQDIRTHLEASYVIQSTPNGQEQTTLKDLILNKSEQQPGVEWTVDEPQELFVHEKLAAAWTGWSIRAADGSIISHKKGVVGLAHTEGRWKISGIASTKRSLDTPKEENADEEIMKPIHALLEDFSHPDWTALKEWFVPNAGVTLYRPPAEPTSMTMEQSIVRLQNMIKSGITIQEKLHDVQVRRHGDMALVWAPFVVEINGAPRHEGVNAFTLLRREGRWMFSGCQDYGVAL
ncbi:hypothetical protein BKA59DRAFT_514496 [Fusarium tricinctum]|uniref:Uncharacterized protein n=1 Tax=Fusarium tricinctum TaxID=61284 RepID=A0A8K0RTP8_9HYPO|nr:hypothetical protein BKA59DRAFT_514496 [Fusarium tricinctum]